MKIALGSDLHLEFGPITLTNTEGARVLILSGDILVAEYLHRNPIVKEPTSERESAMLGSTQVEALLYRRFLDNVNQEFDDVIYVAGNHEFYHGKFPDAIDWLRTECAKYKNIHYLELDKFELDDITFVGGTIWTDFNKADPITMSLVDQRINDYHRIRYSKQGYRKLIPADILKYHRTSIDYLKSVLDHQPDKKFVVVGHQAPTPMSIHPAYRDDFHLNGAYATDLSEFILDRPQIKLWTHGHVHHDFDYMLGDTRIACNPRGYIGMEHRANSFALKILEV